MIVNRLKPPRYEALCKYLCAHAQPLDLCYTIEMTVCATSDLIKPQPEPHCKIAVLQAIEIEVQPEQFRCSIVKNNDLLFSLLDFLIFQGMKEFPPKQKCAQTSGPDMTSHVPTPLQAS